MGRGRQQKNKQVSKIIRAQGAFGEFLGAVFLNVRPLRGPLLGRWPSSGRGEESQTAGTSFSVNCTEQSPEGGDVCQVCQAAALPSSPSFPMRESRQRLRRPSPREDPPPARSSSPSQNGNYVYIVSRMGWPIYRCPLSHFVNLAAATSPPPPPPLSFGSRDNG